MITQQNLRYDKMLYKSGPVTFTDFINNKYDKIHNQLYRDALQKMLVEHPEYSLYRSSYTFIEQKQPEYWQPSYVSVISKHYPHTKERIWLDKYWCNYQNKNKNDYSYLLIDEDTIKDAEIIEMNYVTGEAVMKSKFTDVSFAVPFNKLNENTPISPDYSLDDTFTIKSGRG